MATWACPRAPALQRSRQGPGGFRRPERAGRCPTLRGPARSGRAHTRDMRRWRGFGGRIGSCSVGSSSAAAPGWPPGVPCRCVHRFTVMRDIRAKHRCGGASRFFNEPGLWPPAAMQEPIQPGHPAAWDVRTAAASACCSMTRSFARIGLRRPGVFLLDGRRFRSRSAREVAPAVREIMCRPTQGLQSSGADGRAGSILALAT